MAQRAFLVSKYLLRFVKKPLLPIEVKGKRGMMQENSCTLFQEIAVKR